MVKATNTFSLIEGSWEHTVTSLGYKEMSDGTGKVILSTKNEDFYVSEKAKKAKALYHLLLEPSKSRMTVRDLSSEMQRVLIEECAFTVVAIIDKTLSKEEMPKYAYVLDRTKDATIAVVSKTRKTLKDTQYMIKLFLNGHDVRLTISTIEFPELLQDMTPDNVIDLFFNYEKTLAEKGEQHFLDIFERAGDTKRGAIARNARVIKQLHKIKEASNSN